LRSYGGLKSQDATWYGGRPLPKRHCVTCGLSSPLHKQGANRQFSPHLYYGQTATWIKMPLGKEVGLGPGDIVLDGDPAPPPQKGGTAPIFRLCLFWPNGCMDQDATWYDGKPRPGQHFVRCGPSSPPPKGHSPQFSSHICCSQMVRWITMPIGRKVGLDPSDIVLDGNPALLFPKQGQSTPIFGPFLICPNGRMDQGATWYGGRPRPRRRCVNGDHAPPKGGTAPPVFGPCLS